jgi:molybdenum cofactor cytidylyltransferase
LIVLADQPFLQPSTLDLLIHHYRQGTAQIVVPTWQGTRGNPVLLDRSVFADAMALQGDVGCRAIFGKYPESLLKVEVQDEGILLDIDHREDYERLVRRAKKSSRLRTGG